MMVFKNIIFLFVVVFSLSFYCHAGLTNKPADLTLRVSNFDLQSIILVDKRGQKYKIPREKFSVNKFKVHQTFKFYSVSTMKYKIKKKVKKK